MSRRALRVSFLRWAYVPELGGHGVEVEWIDFEESSDEASVQAAEQWSARGSHFLVYDRSWVWAPCS